MYQFYIFANQKGSLTKNVIVKYMASSKNYGQYVNVLLKLIVISLINSRLIMHCRVKMQFIHSSNIEIVYKMIIFQDAGVVQIENVTTLKTVRLH